MVFEKVKEAIVDQLDIDAGTVTMESNILEDLGADSLDVVELIMSLEDQFDMTIPDDKMQDMKTVGDIVRLIEANKK